MAPSRGTRKSQVIYEEATAMHIAYQLHQIQMHSVFLQVYFCRLFRFAPKLSQDIHNSCYTIGYMGKRKKEKDPHNQ